MEFMTFQQAIIEWYHNDIIDLFEVMLGKLAKNTDFGR
jgi:hypothetical protein